MIDRTDEIVNTILGTGLKEQPFNEGNIMKDHIPVVPGEILHFKQSTTVGTSYCFRWQWYDKDGIIIARKADTENQEFDWTVPDNAYSIWVSYPNTGDVSLTIVSSPST